MNIKLRRMFFSVAACLLLVPATVFAADPVNKYNFPDLLKVSSVSVLINRIIGAALSVVGVIFFVLFLWGGVQWLMAGGEADKVKKAVATLRNAVIGLLIVATSYALVNAIIDVIASAKQKG